jgi:predicted nucleic acid-binding protein
MPRSFGAFLRRHHHTARIGFQWVVENAGIERDPPVTCSPPPQPRVDRPDALQAATAVRAQATGLVTNDAMFARVEAFETLVLDHHLPATP